MPPTVEDPHALLSRAEEAAHRAGGLLLDAWGEPRRSIGTKSSPTDMVSEMDRASEALLRSLLTAGRPGDVVLGEEGGEATAGQATAGQATAGTTAVRWIVDPLDGTTNYLYGFPTWSVSVAAEVNGVVVAGVVFDPTRDETFRAVRGSGATVGEAPLNVSSADALDTALVGTGFAYDRRRRAEQAGWLPHILSRVRDIRRAGSAALDLCSVAAGRLDAYYEQGTQVWDWAAGALIATEAGAWVGGFDGGTPGPEGIIAAAPHLAGPMRDLLAVARRTSPAVRP